MKAYGIIDAENDEVFTSFARKHDNNLCTVFGVGCEAFGSTTVGEYSGIFKKIVVDDISSHISPESKCLLIGANETGRCIYKILQKNHLHHTITGWIDKKYAFFACCGLPVIAPHDIPKLDIGIIVIAGYGCVSYANQIIEEYQLNTRNCGYFFVPTIKGSFDDFVYPNIHYTDEIVSDDELEILDPISLVTNERLDIVIRYIACCELLNGTPGCGMDMYNVLSMSMNAGEEYIRPFTTCSYFSAYKSKKGFDEFKASFEQLVASMKKNGFDKRHFIPLSEGRGVINGTHRLATALALNEKVYVKIYQGFGEPFLRFAAFDLERIGYTDEQISYILNVYHTLKE